MKPQWQLCFSRASLITKIVYYLFKRFEALPQTAEFQMWSMLLLVKNCLPNFALYLYLGYY